jgi:hypothetical protein
MPDLSAFSTGPAIGAIVAAAVTAALAGLKFYSDKATKVTDFRQGWIQSLRNDVAEFSGSMHTIAGRIAIRNRHGEHQAQSSAEARPKATRLRSVLFESDQPAKPKFDKEFETELLEHWSTLRLSYNKIILHLNPVEHLAYIRAEEAIAAFAKAQNEDPVIRKKVEDFLWWCIQLAESNSTTEAIKERQHHALDRIYLAATGSNRGNVAPTPDLIGQDGIRKLAAGAGSCLLLAAFATRQLLHGSYEDVLKNIPRIEHGIRVIDTAAAIVIKNIWEEIKRGEPIHRKISRIALLSAPALFLALAAVLYLAPDKQEKKLITSCDWSILSRATPGSPSLPDKVKLSCETTSPP